MGLLDDAIREHLDLKRRRGEDPAAVARAEQEALGPVRREPEPEPAEPAAEEPATAEAEPAEHHPPEPEPAPVVEPDPDPRHSDIVHQPTTEFHVEEHEHDERHDAPPSPMDEDVLEETPDFLQETPEHDRLWFEQRPPRDFDFDG